jgi:hypothetical protein
MESPAVAKNPPPEPLTSAGADPAVAEELHCPLCDYNLRGTVEPRCPECGYQFEWDALRDPARRLHPYLFEHHPERNLGSFARTFVEGLRPARFWKSLLPVQHSSPRRLTLYGLIVGLATVLIGPVLCHALVAFAILATGVGVSWRNALGMAWNATNIEPAPELFFAAFALYVLWAVATFFSLLVFRISMRRARIHPVHVARCVVYSFDAVIWPALATCVATAVSIALALLLSKRDFALLSGTVAFAPWVLIAMVVYRLVSAYRHYLRFDHPFLTILASQVIAGLVLLNVVVYWTNLTD